MVDAGAFGSVGRRAGRVGEVPVRRQPEPEDVVLQEHHAHLRRSGAEGVRRLVGGEPGHVTERGVAGRGAAARWPPLTRAPAIRARATTERFMRTKMLTSASLHASMNKMRSLKRRVAACHQVGRHEVETGSPSRGETPAMTMSRMANRRPISISSHTVTRRRLLTAGLATGLAADRSPALPQAVPYDPESDDDPDFHPVKFRLPALSGRKALGTTAIHLVDRSPAGPDHAQRSPGVDDQRLVPGLGVRLRAGRQVHAGPDRGRGGRGLDR